MNVNFTGLDLRLLRFLQLLIKTGSVTLAGEEMGISQPAASRILARIRDLTGDSILIRTQNGYQLTDYASTLNQPVLDAISALNLVFRKSVFDPQTSTARIRVASTDYGAACVLGPSVQTITELAPSLNLEVSALVPDSFSMLDEGQIDILLYADTEIKGDYIAKKLYDETYSLIFRSGHPVTDLLHTRDELGVDDIGSYTKLEFAYPTQQFLQTDTIMRKRDKTISKGVSMPFYSAIPLIIADSDVVAPIPTRLAELLSSWNAIDSAPFRVEEGFPYYLIWHIRSRNNPALSWFRQQIIKNLPPSGSHSN